MQGISHLVQNWYKNIMANIKLIKENILISLDSIKSHLLRTVLTVMIIAFGIMALVGILTAIDAVEYC